MFTKYAQYVPFVEENIPPKTLHFLCINTYQQKKMWENPKKLLRLDTSKRKRRERKELRAERVGVLHLIQDK